MAIFNSYVSFPIPSTSGPLPGHRPLLLSVLPPESHLAAPRRGDTERSENAGARLKRWWITVDFPNMYVQYIYIYTHSDTYSDTYSDTSSDTYSDTYSEIVIYTCFFVFSNKLYSEWSCSFFLTGLSSSKPWYHRYLKNAGEWQFIPQYLFFSMYIYIYYIYICI